MHASVGSSEQLLDTIPSSGRRQHQGEARGRRRCSGKANRPSKAGGSGGGLVIAGLRAAGDLRSLWLRGNQQLP